MKFMYCCWLEKSYFVFKFLAFLYRWWNYKNCKVCVAHHNEWYKNAKNWNTKYDFSSQQQYINYIHDITQTYCIVSLPVYLLLCVDVSLLAHTGAIQIRLLLLLFMCSVWMQGIKTNQHFHSQQWWPRCCWRLLSSKFSFRLENTQQTCHRYMCYKLYVFTLMLTVKLKAMYWYWHEPAHYVTIHYSLIKFTNFSGSALVQCPSAVNPVKICANSHMLRK